MGNTTKYWQSLSELHETEDYKNSLDTEFAQEQSVDEFLADERLGTSSTSRRDFLKFLGFSVTAAAIASCEAPVIKAVPYVNRPEDVVPGAATWYASTYYDGNTYSSILVKTREGRPIFVKGNRDMGITRGGANPRVVGSVLSLYDSERLTEATISGEGKNWADVDQAIMTELQSVSDKGGRIAILSNTITGPSTLYGVLPAFAAKYGSGEVAFKGLNGMGAMAAPAPQPVAAAGDDMVEDAPEMQNIDVAAIPVEEPAEMTAPAGNGNATVEHYVHDAVSYSGIRRANLKSFGSAMIPSYDFSKAKVIVSISADFLNSWLLPTEFQGQYGARRNPEGEWMSKHFQFETNMSVTGSNADERAMIKPSEQGKIAAALLSAVGGGNSGVKTDGLSEAATAMVKKAAEALKAANGEALVVAGSNNENIQLLVNAINNAVGAYGNTIDTNKQINLFQGDEDQVKSLIADMNSGKISALLVWGANPVYTLPNGEDFASAMEKVGTTISFAGHMDETAVKCKYVCPDHHMLEKWDDHNPKTGHYALTQPVIMPLHKTKAAQESLMVWADMAARKPKVQSRDWHDFIKSMWVKEGFPRQDEYTDVETYWGRCVHDSCNEVEMPAGPAASFGGDVSAAGAEINKVVGGENWELALYQSAAIGLGEQASNPWLQEMSDPLTKVSWDNYITMSPKDVAEFDFEGYLAQESHASVAKVTIGEITYELPVVPQPGQMPGTIGIALGYGRGKGEGVRIGKAAYHTGEYGGYLEGDEKIIGQNGFRMMPVAGSTDVFDVKVESAGSTYPLAVSQMHSTVMGRHSIIRETSFDHYKKSGDNNASYNPDHALAAHEDGKTVKKGVEEFDLWQPHPVERIGHRWGLSIDLNNCIGCGSCLVACVAENNVPVVGKDEVRRGRDMHWLRLDRYYKSDFETTIGDRTKEWKEDGSFEDLEKPSENPSVVFMPMMCQHCNHAPCETVCPVAATTHSNEGFNQMAYNRCIGTRYCANNCPYKVRRFNWFNYPSYKKFGEVNPAQDNMSRMVLNPDVVVRERGVMEKCSLCVQRVQEGKLNAKMESREVVDGDVSTACSDVCPTHAITVGDWNDQKETYSQDVNGEEVEVNREGSKLYNDSISKRAYQALEEGGFKPNIWYQVKVRNIDLVVEEAPAHHEEEVANEESH